ncbi:MAG: DMT family transporter [Rhizobiaceae bacterium]|nr:DMT family transporter [Rhizobiaceae bacterium]
MTRGKANLLLAIAAGIWGMGFVAQSTAMEHVGPMVFTGLRFLAATLAVLPFALAERRAAPTGEGVPWRAFMLIGVFLFLAIASQQYGLLTTSVSNSGFLTGLYVVFTPMLGLLLFRLKPHWAIWPGGAMALTGIYLLTGAHASELVPGDVMTVFCALMWAFQVLLVARAMAVSPRPYTLAATQFAICAGLGLALALPTEVFDMAGIIAALPEILFAGIISGGLAFTLQIIGQRHTTPGAAALILSTEALFAAMFAALLLGERLGPTAMLGAGLILAAILLVELAPLAVRRNPHASTSG